GLEVVHAEWVTLCRERQEPPVRGEGGAPEARAPGELAPLAGAEIPDAHDAAVAPRGDGVLVGEEHDRNRQGVAGERLPERAGRDAPDIDRRVLAGGGKEPPARREALGPHLVGVPREDAALARADVPEPRRVIVAGARQPPAVGREGDRVDERRVTAENGR